LTVIFGLFFVTLHRAKKSDCASGVLLDKLLQLVAVRPHQLGHLQQGTNVTIL
jgi:hypothetical protein